MNNKFGLKIFRWLSFVIVICFITLIGVWYINSNNAKKKMTELSNVANVSFEYFNEEIPFITFDYRSINDINNDSVGWIKVFDTNIDYPVVRSNDNEFYLNKNFYGEIDSAGCLFMDYRNDPYMLNKNTIVYGYSKLDGTLFGSLDKLLYSDWHKNNKYIMFNLDEKVMTWEVFSIYENDNKDYTVEVYFSNNYEFLDYIDNVINKSDIDFNIDINSKDNILTLCSVDENNNISLVVHAKLVYSK